MPLAFSIPQHTGFPELPNFSRKQQIIYWTKNILLSQQHSQTDGIFIPMLSVGIMMLKLWTHYCPKVMTCFPLTFPIKEATNTMEEPNNSI